MKAIEEFYNYAVPQYILDSGKTFITININDWRGNTKLKVTLKDVIDYYATQANNIVSGCRTLAGHTGDWRPIDYLAKECLEWFKFINMEELRREGNKHGMELKG